MRETVSSSSGYAPATPRTYLELRHRIVSPMLDHARQRETSDLIAQRVRQWESEGLFQLTLADDLAFGAYGEQVVLGVLTPDLAALPLPDLADTDAATRLADGLIDSGYPLRPLPYSPLR